MFHKRIVNRNTVNPLGPLFSDLRKYPVQLWIMLLEALLPVPGLHGKYSQEEDYTPQTDPPAPASWYWALLQNVHRSAYQLLLPLCILPHYVLHPKRQTLHWKSLSDALVTAFSGICGKLLHEVLSDFQSQRKNLHNTIPIPDQPYCLISTHYLIHFTQVLLSYFTNILTTTSINIGYLFRSISAIYFYEIDFMRI